MDITFYLTIATIIATVAGAVTGLASSFFSARLQKKQLKIQEDQTGISNQVQYATMGMQMSAQFSTMLQECYTKRDELSEINRNLKIANTGNELKIQRAVSHIKELIETHAKEAAEQSFDDKCLFFQEMQTELGKLFSILTEVNGNG